MEVMEWIDTAVINFMSVRRETEVELIRSIASLSESIIISHQSP